MGFDFPYFLTDAEACARLQRLGMFFQNKHGMQVSWLSGNHVQFVGTYLGARIQGELVVGNQLARFRGADPGLLLRKRAQDYVESKLRVYLNPRVLVDMLPVS
jgi:hypothetical protein